MKILFTRYYKPMIWTILFLLTVVAGVLIVKHYVGGYEEFLRLLKEISLSQWLLLLLLTGLFYFLDYVRFYSLFSILGHKLSLSRGLELTAINYFVSSLTPTAEFTLPAMAYFMKRDGVPAASTIAIGISRSFYMIMWIFIFSVLSLQFRSDVHLPLWVSHSFFYWTLPADVLILLFLITIIYPQSILRWTSKLLSMEKIPGLIKKLISGFNQCAESISFMGKSRHPMHFVCHIASILYIVLYIAIGGFLCDFLRIGNSLTKNVIVFSNSLLVAYLSPVPGSIGVTEAATNYLLSPKMSERGMMASTLLRFLCWYVIMIPGAIITVKMIGEVGIQAFEKWVLPKT